MVKATRKKKTAAELGTKFTSLVVAADTLQKQWGNESGVDWMSLYSVVDLGQITATDTFDLDDSIRSLSKQEGDYIMISNGTRYWYYNLVPITRFRSFVPGGSDPWIWGTQNTIAQVGRELKFARAFISTDSQFGGTLSTPAFLYVDDIVTGSEDVQVDDPLWLVDMLAAEYVRNDKTRQYMEPNFIADANKKMEDMKRNGGTALEEVISLADTFLMGESW